MSLDFLRAYGARRVDEEPPTEPLTGAPTAEAPGPATNVDLTIEEPDPAAWRARPAPVERGWQAATWPERPRCFIDGKDAGATVSWLSGPGGFPIPVRLSEIGSVAVLVEDGVCRRDGADVERAVSLVTKPFPPEIVDAFRSALAAQNFRLVEAEPPGGMLSWDLDRMRQAARDGSARAMGQLEEERLKTYRDRPTVVDGRLETRAGAHILDTPTVGVVKTHAASYLHAQGLQVMYALAPCERTPLFAIRGANVRFPVISWYLRLSGAAGTSPTWGVVRVELPLRFYESLADPLAYVARLSRFLYEYRCRDTGYDRMPVSLHPIVRAERLLGAIFTPASLLRQRFYRLTGT